LLPVFQHNTLVPVSDAAKIQFAEQNLHPPSVFFSRLFIVLSTKANRKKGENGMLHTHVGVAVCPLK
jgi:hypothetical protein